MYTYIYIYIYTYTHVYDIHVYELVKLTKGIMYLNLLLSRLETNLVNKHINCHFNSSCSFTKHTLSYYVLRSSTQHIKGYFTNKAPKHTDRCVYYITTVL